jgi:hypothetical protein
MTSPGLIEQELADGSLRDGIQLCKHAIPCGMN